MIWQFEFIILILVIVSGIAALGIKDLLGAAILFSAFSFLMCLLWAIMGAVDVAFTEASVAGLINHVVEAGPGGNSVARLNDFTHRLFFDIAVRAIKVAVAVEP